MQKPRRKKSNNRGGKRPGAGRRPTPFSVAFDVEYRTKQEGSRKAALVEVAKSRYPSVPLAQGMERARKAHENKIDELRVAIAATPEVGWPRGR